MIVLLVGAVAVLEALGVAPWRRPTDSLEPYTTPGPLLADSLPQAVGAFTELERVTEDIGSGR
jgi:hypothetical protein